MMYKSVFFGYIAAAIAVVAALVLILIMRHQDRQYETKKLQALTGVLIGSVCMNTMYFLSFFDSLTSLNAKYQPFERAMDILCSFVINLFLFLYLYHTARGEKPAEAAEAAEVRSRGPAEKLFRLGLAVLIGGFLFAGIVYVSFVTDEYRVTSGHLSLAETGQIVLTAVICLISGVYGWLACRSRTGPWKGIGLLAIVNIITAIYNGIGSMVLFTNHYDYLNWTGAQDWNTWFFVLSDALLLLIVIWYFRVQTEGAEPAFAETGSPAFAPADAPIIPEALGLTISEHTVKRHVHNIYEKAGVSRRDELIRKLKEKD